MPRHILSSLPLPARLRRLFPRRGKGEGGKAVVEFMEYRARLVSPLMRRILLVNTVPLGLLALTLLYLTQFQNSLLEAEVSACGNRRASMPARWGRVPSPCPAMTLRWSPPWHGPCSCA